MSGSSADLVTVAATVTTTAGQIVGGRSARESLLIYNNGASTLYVGGSDVTASNGIPVVAASYIAFDGFTAPVYGIVASGTLDVRVGESY